MFSALGSGLRITEDLFKALVKVVAPSSKGDSSREMHWYHLRGVYLMSRPQISSPAPKRRQNMFWSLVRGKHLTALPPTSTINIYTAKVKMVTVRKRKLLKKPLNTFISPSSIFLALIWLNSCMNTKIWNTYVK